MDRAITTLFMLMSLDGKINTGSTNNLDVDKDLIKIDGVKEGLHQYYKIEQTTDLWSLNTGKTQAKIGANVKKCDNKSIVSFVIIDNKNLNENGINYFCDLSNKFVLVTTNKDHIAYKISRDNLHIIYQEKLCLKDLLITLKKDFDCTNITIQSGGTLNALFKEEKLIDYVDIVIAPVLIGGKDTPTVIDGLSLTNESELFKLLPLKLISCDVLKDSYIRVRYKVIN